MAEQSYADEGGAPEGSGDEYVEGDDSAEFDEEDFDMMRNIGDNPMMERVQAALKKQLTQADDRVTLEMREADEDLRRAKQKREDIGVELYGVQQQLAKLQMELEETHNHYNMVTSLKDKAEEETKQIQVAHRGQKEEVEDERKKVSKNQQELDALNATLRQVEQYNEEMKSEIAVTRRATYKAEENVAGMEKGKQRQDLYIDALNEQTKSLHEQLALYEAQLVSQRQETKAAFETLTDAAKEMEAINFEKKQLMQQWKSSLIGMQRRDEALQATHDAAGKQNEAEQAVVSEVEGYKKQIVQEQTKNESLTAVAERLEAERRFVEDQAASVRAERKQLAQRFQMLKKSLEQTDKEMARVKGEGENVKEQTGAVSKNIQIVCRERRKLEEEIGVNKSAQVTVHKAARNLGKKAHELQQAIHDKEVEEAQMENELARIRVDALNTQAHNTQLKTTLTQLVDELKEKDALIEKYELEIRQRNDEIEKKMYVVDRLNRKYEALTADVEEENLGPLEATIKNLGKQIVANGETNREHEREWLKHQTELVAVVNVTEGESEKLHELRSRRTILDQKRMRINGRIGVQAKQLKELETGIRGMHSDMAKLNELLAKNKDHQSKLANQNFAMETEFVNELRELESQSVRWEQQIARCKEEKNDILEKIVETERQIMLWEKKIQLEKETQMALDPEVGQSEARGMEKEIHRMKLRFETLKRDQGRMINEMERAIMKREAITLRHRGKKAEHMTKAQVRKKLKALGVTLKTTATENARFEGAIKTAMEEADQLALELDKGSSEYGKMEDDANKLQRVINSKLYEKQRNLDVIQKQQRLVTRFEGLAGAQGQPPRACVDEAEAPQIMYQLEQVEDEREKIRETIARLRQEHNHLAEVLDRVTTLTDI